MAFSLVFSAVAQCKKVYDVANNIRKVPEEAYILWQQLDALEPIVRVAQRLNTREASWEVVNKALEVVYEVVAQCDVLLTRSEPDGRPTESESWEEWWATVPKKATEQVSRIKLIPKLQLRLNSAVGLLQASLSAALLLQRETDKVAEHNEDKKKDHSDFCVPAFIRARRILHLFESGRLDCCGNQYQIGKGVLYERKKSQEKSRKCLGNVGVVLRRPSLDTYELMFLNAEALEESIASQSQQPQTPGADAVMAASRLLAAAGQKTQAPPKIEAVVRFEPGALVKTLLVRKNSIGRGGGHDASSHLLLRILLPSGDSYEVESFSSCCVSSQLCYFPTSSEAYQHVTIEVAHMLMLFCGAMSAKKLQQIDAILPAVIDADDDAESASFEKDRAALQAYFATLTQK